MKSSQRRGAFTLVELLVVIAIIGVLIALLLPAVQQAREAARRMQCSNQLKQLGLAIHNYHDTYTKMVYAAEPQSSPGSRRRAASWIVRVLPFIEQSAVYDQYVFSGDSSMQEGPNPNATLINNLVISGLNCPSSPLPTQMTHGTNADGNITVQVGNYVGVNGSHFTGGTTSDVSSSPRCSLYYGETVPNGAIAYINVGGDGEEVGCTERIANISFSAMTDGTSNTMMIGEQSDYQFDPTGAKTDLRSSNYLGGVWSNGSGSTYWTQNITTLRHGINTYGGDGNTAPYQHNVSFTSAHPGGMLGSMVDGSVRFVPENIDFAILTGLCDRQDGNVLQSF
ncbi:DUF1559 domain-containing protein [Bremerella sp. JC770]|uniref:DUF1559 domain-containing protein n=1 Tax=Bremerella sp. JC770 TaxID=3232137 RepID=UPI00345A395E